MMSWNGLFFHSPASNVMEFVITMHDLANMFLLSVLIVVLIFLTLVVTSKGFSLKFFENHQLETVWTIVPFLMLLFIITPSLSSLYSMDSCLFYGMSVSVMGHQWYWSYQLKDFSEYSFDSYMQPSETSTIRLADVDNRVVLPNYLPIRFSVSSSDVIHSWSLPSFGVKMDAIPGRINQFCFSSKRTGVFFGQCSEICGANHSFMPIVLEIVPLKHFIKSQLI